MTVPYLDQSSDESSAKWVLALLAALVLHGIVLPTGAYFWPVPEPVPVAVEPRFEGMRVMAVRDDPEAAPEPLQPPRQMVSLPQPMQEERPDDADFEDQYDRRVEREMVNPNDSLLPQASTNEVAPTGALAMPSPPAPAAPEAPRIPAGTMAPTGAGSPEREVSNDGGVPQDASRRDPPSEAQGEDGTPTGDSGGASEAGIAEGSPEPLDLTRFMPTAQTASALLTPGARRNDAIMLEEGDRTALNSVRSLYWSFFNRMQDQLSQHWNPNGVYARHDPTFELHGRRDRYTVLSVTLNADGSLRHAVVERTSGLEFYDDECVRAFRAAAPFLNIPEGLKDENGHARFTFGFLLNMTTRSARVRRLDGF